MSTDGAEKARRPPPMEGVSMRGPGGRCVLCHDGREPGC